MASKVSRRTLPAGETTVVTNDTQKPIELVLQTSDGSTIRTTLTIGASIDFNLGSDGGTLFVLEPEAVGQRFRVVKNDPPPASRDVSG